jgi:hypothetical protein
MQDHYLVADTEFGTSFFRSNLHFLKSNWTMLGRPTVTYAIPNQILGILVIISFNLFLIYF